MTTTPAPGPCPIGDCGWDAEGTLDEHLYEHDYNELRPAVVRLALETDRLRAELARSRRGTLLSAAEIAESVDTETSAEAATRATVIAKLRVEALASDECAKCGHRRGDHRYGGVCTVRRSATTRCACRQYGFPTVTPKGD